MRLLRAFHDIASTLQHSDLRMKLLERAKRVTAGCIGHLPDDELARLWQRLAGLEALVQAQAKG
jgi:hypothetical protein